MGIFRAGMLRACGFQRGSKYSGSGWQLGGRWQAKSYILSISLLVVGPGRRNQIRNTTKHETEENTN